MIGETMQVESAASPLERMDSAELLAALQAAGSWLDAHVAEVNALNVFPVPDGDTGTNMSLTMRAALHEVGETLYPSASEMVRVLAHGALMGARGNSGVIFSQILRGLARGLDAKVTVDARDLAAALREGAVTAYKGVMKPVEGTILTVVREAADAAEQAAATGAGWEQVLEYLVIEAKASLARTPRLLPVLAAAGVVDAGGQGLVFVLEGMLRYLRGEAVVISAGQAHAQVVQAPEGEYNYDTQFIIKGAALDVDAIRMHIAAQGDSVLVVGDRETIKVHVHSDHPGEILEYGLTQGQVTEVIIENMQLQYEAFLASQGKAVPAALVIADENPSDTAIIAVVAGEGLKSVLESLGVSAVVPGGQTMNPSTQDILRAIEGVRQQNVILLPNNGNIILAANQARALTPKQVAIIPTKTVTQGIAALLAFNYQAELDANVAAMADASALVQTIEVTRAVRSAQVNGLDVREGQYIGLLNDDLQIVAPDALTVVNGLVERIGPDNYEIVTMYYGGDVMEPEAQRTADAVRTAFPGLEVEVLNGGQPHYFYIISVE